MTNVFNPADGTSPDILGEDLELRHVRSITMQEMGGSTYIYVGGEVDDGISVFELNSDGSLTNTANYTNGGVHNLDDILALEVGTTLGGTTYLFATGDNIDGLQVYQVGNDGSLTFFDFFADDGTMFMTDAEDITTAIIDGKLHVLSGGDESGISVFTVPCFAAGTLFATPQGLRG